jgi:glucose-1-phosphatase
MKAVLFDLGNVLIPYNHQRSLMAVAALCTADSALVRAIYEEYGIALGLGKVSGEDFYRHVIERTGAKTVAMADFNAAFCAGIGRDDAALAYAVELQARSGVTVGVISNTNAIHVAWLDDHVLELSALDLVMMSNEVKLLKPDPEIFQLALELLDVDTPATLFVDDAPANVAAAQEMGMAGWVHEDWLATRRRIEEWLVQ